MIRNSLEEFASSIRSIWGPRSDALVAACTQRMEVLVRAPVTERWLSELHRTEPSNQELYRDPEHGFVLLAHTEQAGLYRPPHDHGRGWVLYAMQQGEMEMRTYEWLDDLDGGGRLAKNDVSRLQTGEVRAYLPGEIHDTRCVAGPALLFRFTDRDLKKEDRDEHRVRRFVERGGVWAVGTK